MSDKETKPVEVKETVSDTVATEAPVATEGAAETTGEVSADKKRPIEDGTEGKKDKKKKQRRRQYADDLPKEKSDSEGENDEEDDDKLEEEEEDDLAEIDTTNIITTGRRTRGKVIDFTKAAEKLAKDGVEEEEDDNEFEEK